jgi:hypothetical protein
MRTKNLILALLGLCLLNTAEAAPSAAKKVLMEKTVSVFFAPPAHQGVFHFQVLQSGVVQSVDNKNKITKLAVLSQSLVGEVQAVINSLPDDLEVIEERGPRCADAPSSATEVYKDNGKSFAIRGRANCLGANTTNKAAIGLADWIEILERSLTTHFERNNLEAPARIGQEGYGMVEPVKPRIFLSCQEEVFIADDGFALHLEEIPGRAKQYNLVVNRSLFVGPVTESYVVENKTDPRLLGSPARYENDVVKLSVQGTVTPRPDHKLTGSFVKQDSNGNTEIRKLLCKYID